MISGYAGLSAASVKITIRAFSGMNNPSFTITDANTINVIESIYSTKTAASSGSPADTPPYAGIFVESSGTSLPSNMIIQGGYMIASNSSAAYLNTFAIDNNCTFENYILALAVNKGVISNEQRTKISALRNGQYNNRNGDPGNMLPPGED